MKPRRIDTIDNSQLHQLSLSVICGLDITDADTVLTINTSDKLNVDIALVANTVFAYNPLITSDLDDDFAFYSLNGEICGLTSYLSSVEKKNKIDMVYFSPLVTFKRLFDKERLLYTFFDQFERGTLFYMTERNHKLEKIFQLQEENKLTSRAREFANGMRDDVTILNKRIYKHESDCSRW